MKTYIFAALSAVALALPAHAAVLSFDLLEARFDNPVGGNVTSIDDSFTDPITVTWGADGNTQLGVNASGYDFNARPTPFSEAPDDAFALGSFTHFNQPIPAGTAISSIDLFIRGVVSIDGTSLGEKIFDFTIFHDETPNGANPCAYPDDGSDPQGDVNRNGCADEVNIVTNTDTDTFDFMGDQYTLNILGFALGVDDAENGIFNSQFLSAEGFNNNRVLAADFSVAPAVVPVPPSVMLLGSGVAALFGFGAWRRRKTAA